MFEQQSFLKHLRFFCPSFTFKIALINKTWKKCVYYFGLRRYGPQQSLTVFQKEKKSIFNELNMKFCVSRKE